MARFRILLAVLLVLACSRAEKGASSNGMSITSPAFQNNGAIPAKYTCDGANVNPPLNFSGLPAGTKSLALTVQDPDAPGGTFTHWNVWKIPPSTTSIAEGQHVGIEEKNGFGKQGYGGPCPPSGTHHYVFTVYAMSDENPPAMGTFLAKAQLIGTYKKKML